MPKGSVPRGKPYFGAVKSPSPARKQRQAKFKNTMREDFPTTSQYREDIKTSRTKRDIRAEPGSRIKKIKAPVGKGGR
jgi:hypothetical protein